MWEILGAYAQKHTWKFYLTDDDVWHWIKQAMDGSVVEESAIGFEKAADAVADAEKSGYSI